MYRKIAVCTFAIAVLGMMALLPLLAAETPASHTYVGNAKCKMCHKGEAKGMIWEKWLETKHAKSMASLNAEKGETKDPKCLKCHVTGFGDTTAYNLAAPKEEFANVGCEACHGPGSDYKTLTIMKDKEKAVAAGLVIPDEKSCKRCHNEESPTYKGFDYEEALPLGTHMKAIEDDNTIRASAKHYTNGQPIPGVGTAIGDVYVLPDGGCFGGQGASGIRWTNGAVWWFGETITPRTPMHLVEPGSPATK